MSITIARSSVALSAILVTACGESPVVDPGASAGASTGTSTGATGSGAPTGTSLASTGEPSGTTGATTAVEAATTSTTATDTGGTGATTGALCGVNDETAGGPVDWARNFGWPDGYGPLVRALGVGPDGAIALAQRFQGELDFGGGALSTEQRVDVFFALLDAGGGHLASTLFKALPSGGVDGEIKEVRLAVDATGHVYLTGSFSGQLELGGATHVAEFGIEGVIDVLWATYDVYLARFGPDGALVWSRRFGDEASQEALGVALTPKGSVVITGTNKGTLDLGGGPLVAGPGSTSGFYAEFTPDGEHVWSRSFGPPFVAPFAVDIDPEGRISSWGVAGDGADLGGGPLPPGDAFIAQFDAFGAHRWSRRFLPKHDIRAMSVDPTGAVVLTGLHEHGVDGGPALDMFLARLAVDDGALVWNKQFDDTGPYLSIGKALAADPAGDTIVGGTFGTTIDLGDGPFGSAGGTFLAAYDAAGALQWKRLLATPAFRGADALRRGPAGELVLTGLLDECADFGSGALTPIGHEDTLLLRIAP